MTDYSDAIYAATRIVETKRKMDAVDKNDGYVHQDFNNARMDHDTAKSLYALQVAEALLADSALSPPAGGDIERVAIALYGDIGLDEWPEVPEDKKEQMRLSARLAIKAMHAANPAGGDVREALEVALAAASLYINASDRELQDANLTRWEALQNFHIRHEEAKATLLSPTGKEKEGVPRQEARSGRTAEAGVRNDALEEAAKVCERYADRSHLHKDLRPETLALAIRDAINDLKAQP